MREVTIRVSQEWFEVLGLISRHQDGFVWLEVKDKDNND